MRVGVSVQGLELLSSPEGDSGSVSGGEVSSERRPLEVIVSPSLRGKKAKSERGEREWSDEERIGSNSQRPCEGSPQTELLDRSRRRRRWCLGGGRTGLDPESRRATFGGGPGRTRGDEGEKVSSMFLPSLFPSLSRAETNLGHELGSLGFGPLGLYAGESLYV